jgi:hypothetical protein
MNGELRHYIALTDIYFAHLARRRALLSRSARINILVCLGEHLALIRIYNNGREIVLTLFFEIYHPQLIFS